MNKRVERVYCRKQKKKGLILFGLKYFMTRDVIGSLLMKEGLEDGKGGGADFVVDFYCLLLYL